MGLTRTSYRPRRTFMRYPMYYTHYSPTHLAPHHPTQTVIRSTTAFHAHIIPHIYIRSAGLFDYRSRVLYTQPKPTPLCLSLICGLYAKEPPALWIGNHHTVLQTRPDPRRTESTHHKRATRPARSGQTDYRRHRRTQASENRRSARHLNWWKTNLLLHKIMGDEPHYMRIFMISAKGDYLFHNSNERQTESLGRASDLKLDRTRPSTVRD